MAKLQDVVVLLRDGTQRKGTLNVAFNPQLRQVSVVHRGEVDNFSLKDVCCISFLSQPGLPRYKRLPSEVIEKIVTVSGDEFLVRVLPNEVDVDGFMGTPQEDNSPFQRIYFISEGIRSRELTDMLGTILHKEKLADRSLIDKAVQEQKELRARRVGDILVDEGSLSKEDLEKSILDLPKSGKSKKQRVRVGEVLVSEGLITPIQLEEALEKQKHEKGKRLGEILVEAGVISEEAMLVAMAIKLRMRFIDLAHITPSPEARNMVSSSLARKYSLLPIFMDDKKLIVAFSDPANLSVTEDIAFHSGHRVVPVFATREQVTGLIEELYGPEGHEDDELDIELTGVADEGENELEQTQLSEAEKAPIVRLVNRTILDGVAAKASDIHIFPVEGGTRIDFRVNGLLQQYMLVSELALRPMISRIKIVAGMDISERRLPQDGRIQMRASGREVEFRVSVMPGLLGESAVLRILDKGNKPMHLEDLGLSDAHAEEINQIIRSSHGFFLVTGPTGSGKSTTLLAAMASLTTLPRRLISVEDPVEGKVSGINQVQINSAIGFTFARALRNLLRHDPDILMVGEIRDQETAEIAVEAAMTGHMMLSSLHTNDAAGAFPRLINMGVEPFLVADTVKGVMAQHLIPRLCPECRVEAQPESDILTQLKRYGFDYDGSAYKSPGCKACHESGVGGRVLVYELLVVNENIAHLVSLNSSEAEINKAAREAGMVSMAEMALGKAKEGLINLDYVMPLLSTHDMESAS